MSPWKGQPLFPADNKNSHAAATVIRESLKRSNEVKGAIEMAFTNWKAIQNMVVNVEHWGRGKLGMEMRPLGGDWKNQVGACLIFELVDSGKKNASGGEVEERGVMDKYETFLQIIEEKGLEEVFSFKCLLDGNDVVAEYAFPPGAWMTPALDQCLHQQLDNPHEGRDELLQWVRENRQALLDGLESVGVGKGKGKQTRKDKKKEKKTK
ncbi:hypothetical protein HOY82DRAFT_613354 [Tuber indicum]|nr:hypothetical protein HOY82DRAFT_613354 [Tuber indicum]